MEKLTRRQFDRRYKESENNRNNVNRIWTMFILGLLLGGVIGCIGGMLFITDQYIKVFDGVVGDAEINVDVNETELIREYNVTIMPILLKQIEQAKLEAEVTNGS